jgi:MOSC domain-containing protein YiiM
MEMQMKVLSVNVGLPKEVTWKKRKVITGIFKEAVSGPIAVRRLNLGGDRQADLTVHGGPEKAVYAYSVEHYDFWREALPDVDFKWGHFGENLTVEGMDEKELNIGDKFQIGTAVMMVTQPRLPCYKLALKFGRDDIIKKFLDSGRTGFYFSVLTEGEIRAGDDITLISRDEHDVTVPDIVRLYLSKGDDQELMTRAAQLEPLPASWRDYFREQLAS